MLDGSWHSHRMTSGSAFSQEDSFLISEMLVYCLFFNKSVISSIPFNGNSERLYFAGVPKLLQMLTAAMKLKDACSLEEKLCPT